MGNGKLQNYTSTSKDYNTMETSYKFFTLIWQFLQFNVEFFEFFLSFHLTAMVYILFFY